MSLQLVRILVTMFGHEITAGGRLFPDPRWNFVGTNMDILARKQITHFVENGVQELVRSR